MTEVKRHYEDLEASSSPVLDSPSEDAKRQMKPGRKLLENEPKSKRTAQNRAAQRAYRERKERKMKELEDKVRALEDQNVRINTESDFLRAQVSMLKNELTRYRGNGNNGQDSSVLDDFDLPQTVGKLSNPNSSRTNTTNTSSNSSHNRLLDSSDSISDSNNSSANDSSPDTEVSDTLLKTEFPWDQSNGLGNKHNLQLNADKKDYNQIPDLISGSSSSTSPLNENILMDNQNNFEEQLDPFCNKLNEACGTKECPVPKLKQQLYQTQPQHQNQSQQSPNILHSQAPNGERNNSQFGGRYSIGGNSPFSVFNNEHIFDTDNFNFNLSTPGAENDPLSFLNDNNFDINLAFDDSSKSTKSTPLDTLVTEESVYDPLKDEVNTNFNFNEFIKSSLPSEKSPESNNLQAKNAELSSDKSEVVPAPEQTFKCSEIWDRITSHPRYTEIDIDGLCSELKAKAKCSEKGVVVNASDVNGLLAQSAQRR